MKIIPEIFALILLFCSEATIVTGQLQYTPYDDFPGIYRSYKPAYCNDYPDWAKMLYQYPVNFEVLNREYTGYMANHPEEKTAIVRYFKIWRRAVEPHVLPDGTIELPDFDQLNDVLRNTQLNSGKNHENSSTNISDWSFLGPKETFWLNESGSATAPLSCPWQVNVYSFDVANTDNNIHLLRYRNRVCE